VGKLVKVVGQLVPLGKYKENFTVFAAVDGATVVLVVGAGVTIFLG
jgi:hypothetical protein